MGNGWGALSGASKPALDFDPHFFSRVLAGCETHLSQNQSPNLELLGFLLYAAAEKKEISQELVKNKLLETAQRFSNPQSFLPAASEQNFFVAAQWTRLFFDAFSLFQIEKFRESGRSLIEFLDGFYDSQLGFFVSSKEKEPGKALDNALGAWAFLSAWPHLKNQGIQKKAEHALKFIQEKLYDPLLGLVSQFPPNSSSLEYGRLADSSWAALALTEAYLQSGNKSYRDFADTLAKYLFQELWDRDKGAFLSRPGMESSQGDVSPRLILDNAIALEALWRLGYLKGQNTYFKWIDLALHRFLDQADSAADAAVYLAKILDMRLQGRIELEIVGRSNQAAFQKILETLASLYAPRKIISFIDPDDQDYILAHGLDAESYPRLFGCVDLKRRADTAEATPDAVAFVLNAAWRR